ncbi:MAG TPA: pyridoxamine 5'-phosphate oxidase family protein [Terriglobales bacterium]|nr:pyridoxamine 5'-phosphate oxidase family protein [Terriglobales bacterium]
MPKVKASKKAAPAPPPHLVPHATGLPHVPPMYGLKARKKYLPFSHAETRLAKSRNYWICTARPDGRPHSIPVWGFWIDGAVYFGTARSSRKASNLAHNPAVSIHLDSGDDVVILEGTAAEVNVKDKLTFKKLDAASRVKYKMPMTPVPGQSIVYRVRPHVVLAWTEKDFPNNATRWEFEAGTD